MNKGIIINIIGMIIALSLPILGIFYFEETVVGEKLCVDGHGSKNLEGIMCEEIVTTVMGMNTLLYVLLMIVFCGIGLAIYAYGFKVGNDMEDRK